MPALPDENWANAPSVRLVLPGLFWVTLSSASFFRNCRVSTFLGELIVQVSPCFQLPPLLNSQIENSACASSGPSGSAYPATPPPRAEIFLASSANSVQVFGGA